jgi:hypothetical protein
MMRDSVVELNGEVIAKGMDDLGSWHTRVVRGRAGKMQVQGLLG